MEGLFSLEDEFEHGDQCLGEALPSSLRHLNYLLMSLVFAAYESLPIVHNVTFKLTSILINQLQLTITFGFNLLLSLHEPLNLHNSRFDVLLVKIKYWVFHILFDLNVKISQIAAI